MIFAVKSITRSILALCVMSTFAPIGKLRAAGLIIEDDLSRQPSHYKIIPFATEGAHAPTKSYFTDAKGKVLSIANALILQIVRFPDAQNITDESTLATLQAKKTDLQRIAGKIPGTKSYIEPQIAAIESHIARFRSGERMVDGKWLTESQYQRFQADAAAARAAAEAEREKRIAEQKAAEEKRIAEQKAAEEKRIAEQKALEEKRAQEERAAQIERERKEQKAADDLKQANEEFEAAEKRAAESYRTATKGTLAGQVFVSTMGGQSVKLGAVQISLFARDAIDILVAGLRMYADAKIGLTREASASAKAAMEQAEEAEKIATDGYLKSIGKDDFEVARQTSSEARKAADAARDQYLRVARDENFYYSGDFYFGYLRSPLRTAETDADGKFVIEMPRTGAFVIAARNQRSLWDKTERYYWLQPVSLEGQQQRVQNLSNTSLSSTTGTSSLILTRD
jgi:hypothetical protein